MKSMKPVFSMVFLLLILHGCKKEPEVISPSRVMIDGKSYETGNNVNMTVDYQYYSDRGIKDTLFVTTAYTLNFEVNDTPYTLSMGQYDRSKTIHKGTYKQDAGLYYCTLMRHVNTSGSYQSDYCEASLSYIDTIQNIVYLSFHSTGENGMRATTMDGSFNAIHFTSRKTINNEKYVFD